jgi:UDP-2,4-diacetamido-2,4,6-trideoxy-beta-L-altropyranose hydrolase
MTLADYFSAKNAKVLFLCRNLPEYLQNLLVAKHYPMLELASSHGETLANVDDRGKLAHAEWLGVSQFSDAASCKRLLEGIVLDWLVVDHYALDSIWEEELRPYANAVLAIDDLADREHDCDVLLDQNYYPTMAERYVAKVPSSCVKLLGPEFALLRDEFRSLRAKVRIRDSGIHRILFFFGGVDASNYTGRCLCELSESLRRHVAVDVVVGAQHPCLPEITSLCAERDFVLHVQSRNMGQLMASADIAVGATGATSWERCCLGLPALTVSLADNQIDIAQGLQSKGVSIYLGDSAQVNPECVAKQIELLIERADIVQTMSENAFSLVDGLGVVRVFDTMIRYAYINSLH